MFLCSLLHLWHPIIGVGALVGIVEDKAVFLHLGVLGAGLEFWRLGTLCKGCLLYTSERRIFDGYAAGLRTREIVEQLDIKDSTCLLYTSLPRKSPSWC